jgi:peptidoglycan hydrolase FlgJ
MDISSAQLTQTPQPAHRPDDDALRAKATELEAAFLAEMLKFSGLGESSEEFGGGIGEEQFSSFLRQEQAQLMAERGGIGLAESIFNALLHQQERSDLAHE